MQSDPRSECMAYHVYCSRIQLEAVTLNTFQFFGVMGDPEPYSPAWYRKLRANRKYKRIKRAALKLQKRKMMARPFVEKFRRLANAALSFKQRAIKAEKAEKEMGKKLELASRQLRRVRDSNEAMLRTNIQLERSYKIAENRAEDLATELSKQRDEHKALAKKHGQLRVKWDWACYHLGPSRVKQAGAKAPPPSAQVYS